MKRVAAATTVLVLAGCGGSPAEEPAGEDDGSPEATTRQFIEQTVAGDCEATKDLVVTPSLLDCPVVDAFGETFTGVDPDKVKVELIEENGPSAVASITWAEQPDGIPVELFLQETDGEWKVLLDSAV